MEFKEAEIFRGRENSLCNERWANCLWSFELQDTGNVIIQHEQRVQEVYLWWVSLWCQTGGSNSGSEKEGGVTGPESHLDSAFLGWKLWPGRSLQWERGMSCVLSQGLSGTFLCWCLLVQVSWELALWIVSIRKINYVLIISDSSYWLSIFNTLGIALTRAFPFWGICQALFHTELWLLEGVSLLFTKQ